MPDGARIVVEKKAHEIACEPIARAEERPRSILARKVWRRACVATTRSAVRGVGDDAVAAASPGTASRAATTVALMLAATTRVVE
jgi:hypothetical protein